MASPPDYMPKFEKVWSNIPDLTLQRAIVLTHCGHTCSVAHGRLHIALELTRGRITCAKAFRVLVGEDQVEPPDALRHLRCM